METIILPSMRLLSLLSRTTLTTLFILSQLACCTVSAQGEMDQREITFMLITSFGRFGYNSSGTLPAADLALEMINNDTNLLPGYRLVYDTVRDSECDGPTSLDQFFEGVSQSEPVKVAVIGCGCSVATEPVAGIIHHWNIPLISYGTTSSLLSNTTIYPNYYRANPPSTILAPALRSLTQHYEWKRIALLTQDENRFRRVESSIRSQLESVGIMEVESHNYVRVEDLATVEDVYFAKEDFRVFLLNSYPDARIICEASKMGLFYPKYLWIAYGWYAQVSWINGNISDCTGEELKMVLENGISVDVFPIPDDMNSETASGLTPAQFQKEYETRAMVNGYEVLSTTAAQLFDDIWGLALALNATMSMVESRDVDETGCDDYPGDLVQLEQFTYNNSKLGCLFTWNLRHTNFTGVSGRVFFNESLIEHRVTLLQYQVDSEKELTRHRFATIDMADNYSFHYESGFSDETLFPDGVPPDGTHIILLRSIVTPLIVIVDILATAGIVFAICCMIFNIIFRNRRIVKLTSPNLNYFIISGTLLMYCSVYFYAVPNAHVARGFAQASCFFQEWLFTIGYTLAYGALLSKLWRVHTIFNNPAPKKKIFKDWHLMISILLSITGLATFLLFLGAAIPPLRGQLSKTQDVEFGQGKSEQDVTIDYYVLVCHKEVSAALYWRIFIFAYLVVFQILGIMLAFQTRKVRWKGLRDSKFVTANVYISSIVIVIFILVTFALRMYSNVYSAIFSTGILVLTTTFLVLNFVPKMYLLYKDPDREGVRDETTLSSHESGTSNSVDKVEVAELRSRVSSLEKKLKEKDEQLEKVKLESKKNNTTAGSYQIWESSC